MDTSEYGKQSVERKVAKRLTRHPEYIALQLRYKLKTEHVTRLNKELKALTKKLADVEAVGLKAK